MRKYTSQCKNERVTNLDLTEKTLEENLVYDGRIVKLYVDKIECPNGNKSTREYLKHPGGVGVVALTAKNEILFVRQYRYPYKDVILEIPAGKLNYGEDPLLAGKRELREETGAIATTYTSLGTLLPSPGYTAEIIHMYLAENLTFGETDFDEDEFLTLEKIPLQKAVDMVMSGEIADAKSQAAVMKTYYLKNK